MNIQIDICKDILKEKFEQRQKLKELFSTSDIINHLRISKIATLVFGYYGIDETWDNYSMLADFVKQVKNKYAEGELFFERYPQARSRVVKGFVSSQLYQERWWRQISDIDIFMPLQEAIAFHQTLLENGFEEEPGYFEGRVPSPENRRKSMTYLFMNSHELPTIINSGGLNIDTNFRAIYKGTALFRETFDIDSVEEFFYHWETYTQSPTDLPPLEITFFFIVMHHSAELMLFDFEEKSDIATDIFLGKLFDIVLFIKRHAVSESVFSEMLQHSSGQKLFDYLFWTVDQIFSDPDWKAFGEKVGVNESFYKNSFISREGHFRTWKLHPTDRIYPIDIMENSSLMTDKQSSNK